jgi:hypothetical protein
VSRHGSARTTTRITNILQTEIYKSRWFTRSPGVTRRQPPCVLIASITAAILVKIVLQNWKSYESESCRIRTLVSARTCCVKGVGQRLPTYLSWTSGGFVRYATTMEGAVATARHHCGHTTRFWSNHLLTLDDLCVADVGSSKLHIAMQEGMRHLKSFSLQRRQPIRNRMIIFSRTLPVV